MDQKLYEAFVAILEEELVPAMGCTEPIAVAYAAALARQTLGEMPDRAQVWVSANILKNVKSVVVPNTGGQKGINTAVAAGIVAGNADKELEVVSEITEEQIGQIAEFMKKVPIEVSASDSGWLLDIMVRVYAGEHTAMARIAGAHTNVITIEKDGQLLKNVEYAQGDVESGTDRSLLSMARIVEFANEVRIEDVKEILDRQIQCNTAIAEEGMKGTWGASVGKVLISAYGADDVHNRAKAMAAAGSDARMSGCELPVVINSGSGNQGMTTSLPVIVYAGELGVSDEMRYRALVVSNLTTIHLKTGIGRLSAYCGATSAGCGSAAGIRYLFGGDAKAIEQTVVNAVAINSGMICDGAKPSCAAKIASAVEAGLLGMQMEMQGTKFCGGDGIVAHEPEDTIRNVGQVARLGMADTDREIIEIMVKN